MVYFRAMTKTDSRIHKNRTRPDFSFEQAKLDAGFEVIAGVDEAGRGPWAGPVVAGAVILDAENIPAGLNDSKKLSEKAREGLFDKICKSARFGVGIISEREIDDINILQASLKAMALAVANLPVPPDFALIDGNRSPELAITAQTITQGDGRSLSIAAASIIAKVTRDRIMVELDGKFPQYGFARHKGYGTRAHAQALAEHGPCEHHRKSFAPIRALLR